MTKGQKTYLSIEMGSLSFEVQKRIVQNMMIRIRIINPPTTAAVVISGKDDIGKDGFSISKTPKTPPIEIPRFIIIIIIYDNNYRKKGI